MNTDAYSLSDSVAVVGGGPLQFVDDLARNWVGRHYLISAAVIVALVITVLFFVFVKCKEGMSPTATLRYSDSDQFGLGKERMDPGTDRSQSAFAQQVQSSGGASFTIDPNAQAGQPGSLGWQVLHSSDFDCANRKPVGKDAWSWMNNVVRENMDSTDNNLSKIASGY